MNAVRMAGLLRNKGVIPTFAVARGPGSYAQHLPEDVAVHVLDTGAIQSSTLRLSAACGLWHGCLRSFGPMSRFR